MRKSCFTYVDLSCKLTLLYVGPLSLKVLAETASGNTCLISAQVSRKQSSIESIKVTLFAHDKTPEVLSGSNYT